MAEGYASVWVSILVIIASMFAVLLCLNSWAGETVGSGFIVLTKKKDIDYGLLSATISMDIKSDIRNALARKANEAQNSNGERKWHTSALVWYGKYEADKNISLARFVEIACGVNRGTAGILGNTCTGPTVQFWVSIILFLCILANICLLFVAAGMTWHYFFVRSRKQKRKIARWCIFIGVILMWTSIFIYGMASLIGLHINFQLLFVLYTSAGVAPTKLGPAFFLCFILTIFQTVGAIIYAKFPVYHPEELRIQQQDDCDYYDVYYNHAAPQGYGGMTAQYAF